MTRPRWRIGAELLPVFLVLACLAGSMWMITAAYRHTAPRRKLEPPPIAALPTVVTPQPAAAPSPPPTTPAEDPTPKVLARLAAGTAEQAEAAAAADRKAESLERARQAARAEADQWKRREMLIRGQIDSLESRARQIEADTELIALERDVLARQREENTDRQAKARARANSSFAVLPYKGSSGSWQRPVPIECHNGTVTLQPNGPSFSLADLRMMLFYRSNPFIAAIAHELVRAQHSSTPDGAPCVPYFLFVVRPDGIKAYHDARSVLEPLGIAFGYELVEQDLVVDYPDLDDLAEWDDSDGKPAGGDDAPARWPTRTPRSLASDENGSGNGSGVWPSPLQRALSGPESRYGVPPERDERPFAGGAGTAGGDSPGSSAPPNGRVEILPRGGYGRRLGTVPPPPSRWTTPDDWANGNGSRGSNRPTPFDRGGLPPAGAPGRPDDSLPFPPAPPRSAIARGTNPPATSSPAEAGSRLPHPPGELDLEGSTLSPSLTSAPPFAGAPALAAVAESMSEVGSAGAGAGAGVGAGRDSRSRGRASASDSRAAGAPSLGSGRVGSPPTGAAGLPMLAMTPQGASGDVELPPSTPREEMSHLPERALELVVVCGPKGVLIQPGGFRIGIANLKTGDGYLVKQLQSIVRQRQQADTKVFLEPRIRFLVEPGGELTYREVRKQTILSGTGWPVTLQVGEPDQLHLLPRERW